MHQGDRTQHRVGTDSLDWQVTALGESETPAEFPDRLHDAPSANMDLVAPLAFVPIVPPPPIQLRVTAEEFLQRLLSVLSAQVHAISRRRIPRALAPACRTRPRTKQPWPPAVVLW